MIRVAAAALLLAPLTGACTVPLNTTGICAQEPAQGWVGQVYNERVAKRIKLLSLAQRMRIVRPGEMTTMEFDNRRVTIAVDARNRVERITCG